MSAPGPETCEAVTTYAWHIGALCGLVVDVSIVVAIALTPRLREHGGEVEARGAGERSLGGLSMAAVALIWSFGLYRIGTSELSRYAAHTAFSAVIVIGCVLVPLVITAATQIARRSIW